VEFEGHLKQFGNHFPEQDYKFGKVKNDCCQKCEMKLADINGDKMIDYEELVKFIYDEETDPKEQMREAFRLCDTDRNGFICKKELAEFMKLCAETMFYFEGSDMMEMFDQDGDGKLSYQEFCDMME